MDDRYKKAVALTNEYGQEHLLKYYDYLNDKDKSELVDEILSVNFSLIKKTLKETTYKSVEYKENKYKPLIAKSLKNCSEQERQVFYNCGLDALSQGKVAVYLVAGGQGTRLGHKGPKGTYDIGLPSGKSLFQLQCERLIYLSQEAKKEIPLYIMTSIDNHDDTTSFFEKHNYFGYPKEMIMFFKQRTMPAIDKEGKLLLQDKNKLVMSPNGNGGCFVALKESGALSDMKAKGIEWLFLYGIDNALVRVADPYFIGFTIYSKQLAASKVVEKKNPEEKVGILCYKNDRPAIVEYSEIPQSMTVEIDSNGKLKYSNANILNHILSINFIEAIIEAKMPLHIAHKKIEHIDEHGIRINPEKPNGYKFEYFLFDSFELLEDMAALEVEREEEFAPVKNKEGEDSPKTARDLILKLHKKWLLAAGYGDLIQEHTALEISPLDSYNGEKISEGSIKNMLTL